MGAALIPLGAWPQILPFAVLGAVVAGLIAVEVWTGGKMTRAVREAWQRRKGFVPDGVARDLALLYELREADERALTAFVGEWRSAKDDQRSLLVRIAADDEALWREKLTAAYLAGASPEMSEVLLSAINKAGRRHLEPLTPIMDRVLSNRGKLDWTVHSDAVERLDRLKALAAGQSLAAPMPEPAERPKLSLRAKLGRGVSVFMLAVMLAASGASTIGTIQFSREQVMAREQATRIFFADDMYVFTDRYVDTRIPEIVLPALRNWSSASAGDQAALERALTVLRESPDPKADNILLVLFKRGDIIPLSDRAQTTLLTALMERESEELWALMERSIVESANNPGAVALLKKMIVIGAELGTERSFINLFRVLKSPNEEVRRLASETLYGSLTEASRATEFYERLTKVQQRFAADPVMQLWTAQFALRHLSTMPAGSPQAEEARELFDAILAGAGAHDTARLAAITAALAAGQQPDVPAFLPSLLGLIANMERVSQGPNGAQPVPAALAGMSRYVVNKAMTRLIRDAEEVIPGLHERLVADGVVNPDVTSSGYYGGYEDYDHGHGRGAYYGSSTSRSYRETYKLSHVRKFSAALQEMGGALASDPARLSPALIEVLTRAGASLEPLANAAQLSGMLEGGTPAELAAEALQPTLEDGVNVLGDRFLFALRSAGLAPAIGDPSSVLAYPESLDSAGLASVRNILMERVRSGQGWADDGTLRPLEWDEKRYLARALVAVDAAIAGRAAAPLSDDAFFASLNAPGEASIALARLKSAIDARHTDAAYLLRAEAVLLQRLAAGQPATAQDLAELMIPLFNHLKVAGREAEAWRLLADAMAAHPQADQLKLAVQVQTTALVRSLGTEARLELGSDFGSKLFAEGVMLDNSTFRSQFTLRHLRAFQAALADERANGRGPDVNAARRIAPLLHEGYRVFPGTVFLDELRARGLALNNGSTGMDAYPTRYTRAELLRLQTWARAYQRAGVTSAGYAGAVARPFTAEERRIVDNLVAELAATLAAYPASGAFTPAQREAMMSPAERAVFARAAMLDTVIAAAERAGVARGDAPAEIAAEKLAGWMHRGYQVMPGSVFLEDMRAAGFALNNGVTDRVGSYPTAMSRAEVERLHRWMLAYQAAGVTRGGGNGASRAFTPSEKAFVDEMTAEVGRVLREYPTSPAPTRLRGLALGLPLLAAAPVVPAYMLIGLALLAAAAFAAWAVWAGRGEIEDGPAPRDGVSPDAVARHKRVELAAERLAKSAQWGAFRSRAKGDGGLEYAESRDFEPGDTLRDVDWIEYAQNGELRTKVFDQEREMPLILVIDVSQSGDFGTRGSRKSEVIEDVSAVLALAAARTNLRVGAVLFSDRVEAVIPPGGGKSHGWRVAQAALQARPVGTRTDLRPALAAAAKLGKTRSIITVLSDFIAPDDYKEALSAAAARHDVRLIRVTDAAETNALPDVGLVPVADAETGEGRLLDTSSREVRREVAGAVARREARIEEAFAAVRTRPIVLTTGGDALDQLAARFQPKTKTGAVLP